MEPIKRRPLREEIADRLRSAIQDGSLSPSENLQEVDAAEHLGVSRTPTREALVQLEREGYVVMESGRGFRVAPVSMEDAIQIERLVANLERLAVAESTPPMTKDLEALRRAQKKFAVAKGSARQQELDERWHSLLTARCTNRWTHRYLSELKGHVRRYCRVYLAAPGSHERSIREHEAVMAHLERGKMEGAAELLEAHWIGGIARVASSEDAEDGSNATE